ncbi:transcription factor TFIIIB component B'' homolog [Fopius arisanus]|uniref:Transcription factor TFIIIB component B'' homolog n=2 Tax=Fopius arisanus TaxID=64838 RepID=A0A9R1TTG8_9HYME|nr:PREDICTED: transcription factor TFIIIB component B'' homolog [Fopius arisanus]
MRRARIKVTASVPLRRKVITVEDPGSLTKDSDSSKEETPLEVPEQLPEASTKQNAVEEVLGEDSLCEKTPERNKDVAEKATLELEQKTSPLAEALSKRPRLFSESSDSKGHLSGPENASPAKTLTNRSFTRPTPRLDGSTRIRRNSVQGSGASASESEDDSRRHPLPSHPPPMSHPSQAPQTSAQSSSGNTNQSLTQSSKQKRKMLVSESARKLAEARREFLLKHENNPPDRTKLTMYDLIYYNPTTNPMKKTATLVRVEPEEVVEPEEEEDESEMPVPQLKVGVNGELVVDEQSLVIENMALKRDQDAVSRRRVLVDEEGAIGGFYKKRTKSKDWTPLETLKFYKALNTVGTDFSLMQTVFPNRNRHELKMKFKKEEKLNRTRVEKALVYHQEYDIETLKKDLESFENIEETSKKTRKSNESYRKRCAKRRLAATSLNMLSEEEDDPEEMEGNSEQKDVEIASKVKQKRPRGKNLPDNSKDSITEDDSEVYKVKPTRSGRLPKKKRVGFNPTSILDRIFDKNTENDEEVEEDKEEGADGKEQSQEEVVGEPVKGLQDIEPGSLVIVSKESPDEPGKTIVQVYMVGKDLEGGKETMTPMDLSSELLATVTKGLKSHGVIPR